MHQAVWVTHLCVMGDLFNIMHGWLRTPENRAERERNLSFTQPSFPCPKWTSDLPHYRGPYKTQLLLLLLFLN